MSTLRILIPCIAALSLLSLGCGSSEKAVKVSGKLMKGGAAYDPSQDMKGPLPPEDPGVRVVFTRLDGATVGEEFQATVDKSAGTFTVPGHEGNGIPPSRYQVKVFVGALGSSTPTVGKTKSDLPPEYQKGPKVEQSAFSYGRQIATHEVEVTKDGASDIVIEIGKK